MITAVVLLVISELIAVGHLDRQAQVELVVGTVIQVSVYLHLVVERRLAWASRYGPARSAGLCSAPGAAGGHCLGSRGLAARHPWPGEGSAVVVMALLPIHHTWPERVAPHRPGSSPP